MTCQKHLFQSFLQAFALFFSCLNFILWYFFFFSSRRRHTRSTRDWSSDVCSSDLSALNRPSQSLLTRAMQSPSRRNRRLLDQAASPVLPQLHLPASVSMPRPASPTFIWPFSQPSRSPSLSTVFRHPMTNPCSRCPPLLFSFPRSLSFIPTLTLGLSRLV